MKGKNPRKQIILSISILVSGREETVGKCLDSLETLRRKVPCELILTDTGCAPQLWERLRQRAGQDCFAPAQSVLMPEKQGGGTCVPEHKPFWTIAC